MDNTWALDLAEKISTCRSLVIRKDAGPVWKKTINNKQRSFLASAIKSAASFNPADGWQQNNDQQKPTDLKGEPSHDTDQEQGRRSEGVD